MTVKTCKSTGFPGSTRLIAWLLALFTLSLFPLALTSCGATHGEEERAALVARAAELLPRAVAIDDLLYVTGVPVLGGEENSGGYAPADMEALAALGFSSVADIKAEMRGIWTERYVAGVERSAIFSSVSADGQMASYAYVIDDYDRGDYRGVRVRVRRDDVLCMDTSVYDLSTITYVSGTKKSAKLTVMVTVTNAGGTAETRSRDLTLACSEDGIWRLDSATYNRLPREHGTKS